MSVSRKVLRKMKKVMGVIGASAVLVPCSSQISCAVPWGCCGGILDLVFASCLGHNSSSIHVKLGDGSVKEFVKGECIGSGVQGRVFKCSSDGDDSYVLKEIDFNKIGHNPVVSEVLAYNKLKDLQCEHIVKPVHYVQEAEKKARFIYKFANGEKIDDDSLKKKIGNFNGSSRRKLLVSIVDQLLGVVDLLHNEYGIAHGDMNHENYLIHIDEKNEASVRVIDFGYCYELKDKYVESDIKDMCHPVTSVIHFVKGIYVVVCSLIGKDEANKFCNCVLSEISDNLCCLVKDIVIKLNWPKFDWRMKHINEILKVDTKECDTVIVNVRKYIDGIRLSLG